MSRARGAPRSGDRSERTAPVADIAARHNLTVIEDAAHAIGSEYRNRSIGNISPLTAFSFYATKNLTTGEGGMVTTSDSALADRIRSLSLHGLNRDAWKRYAAAGNWYYEVNDLSFLEKWRAMTFRSPGRFGR